MNTKIKEIMDKISKEFSLTRTLKRAGKINKLERDFNFNSFRKSAEYCYSAFSKIKGVITELLPYSADGKTIYHDTIAPIGWNGYSATLSISGAVTSGP